MVFSHSLRTLLPESWDHRSGHTWLGHALNMPSPRVLQAGLWTLAAGQAAAAEETAVSLHSLQDERSSRWSLEHLNLAWLLIC